MTLDAELTARHAGSTLLFHPRSPHSLLHAPHPGHHPDGAHSSSFLHLGLLGWFFFRLRDFFGKGGGGVKTGRQYTTTVWRWDGIPFEDIYVLD